MTAGQVLVLAKVPAPGRTKTRLCPPCTPRQAADVAAAALADTLDAVQAAAVDRRILATDGPLAAGGLAAAQGPGWTTIRQRGAGLAERIAAAFADAGRGCPCPTLQIGMDTPQVTGELLGGCLASLHDPRVDAVLGPAEDGGWWALGLRDPARAAVLAGVPMSTPDTGRLTVAALRSAGLRVGRLPLLRDVDTWPDAVAVARRAPHTRFAGCIRALQHAA